MGTLIKVLANAVAVFVAAYILPGVSVDGVAAVLITAVVLGVVNTFIRPVLVFLTLPITLMTLGLFLLVINALLILLVSLIIPGFAVANFWWALLFGLVVSLVGGFLGRLERD